MDQNILNKVNQSVLQERINSTRNQKEQIRQRLQNPGLYQDSATPNTSIANLNEYYRPSQAFKNDLSSVFKYAEGSYGGDATLGNPTGTAPSGPAMNAQTAQTIGNLAGLVSSYTGTFPGGFGGTISGALSGNPGQTAKGVATMGMNLAGAHPAAQMAVNYGIDSLLGKSPSMQDMAKNVGLMALFSAVPQAKALYSAYTVAKSIADVFGLTDIGGVFGPSDNTLGYSDSPAFQGNISFGEEQDRDISGLTPEASDYNPDTYAGPKVSENPTGIEGGYSAFGDSSLSGDVSSGSWGGSADSDY